MILHCDTTNGRRGRLVVPFDDLWKSSKKLIPKILATLCIYKYPVDESFTHQQLAGSICIVPDTFCPLRFVGGLQNGAINQKIQKKEGAANIVKITQVEKI